VREKGRLELLCDLGCLARDIIFRKKMIKERVKIIERLELGGSKILNTRVKAFRACPHVADIWGNHLSGRQVCFCLGGVGLPGRCLIPRLASKKLLKISHFIHIPGEVHLLGWNVKAGEARLEVHIWLWKVRWGGVPKGHQF